MPNKKNDDYVVPMPEGSHELEPLDGERNSSYSTRNDAGPPVSLSKISNSFPASILGYCLASISMTVVNKYVVSGSDWNLMFLYLTIQVSHLTIRSVGVLPANTDITSHRQSCV